MAEDIDAFNQGVGASEESGRTGISLGDPCIVASEEHGPYTQSRSRGPEYKRFFDNEE